MDADKTPPRPRPATPVGVQFWTAGRIQPYDAGALDLQVGDQVVVQADHGNRVGTVVVLAHAGEPDDDSGRLPRVLRRVDARDLDKDDRNRLRERDALRLCLQRVRERRMQMKLIKAEQTLDAGKITFYFSAEGRIDFRDLVRELAHQLHTRIEMKQIGARDEAKVIGAIGPCGRELCCSTFLREPGGVSVKMAKAQGLSPNPSKLAGMCGRLKCCLRYEYDTYLELGRQLPSIGSRVVSVKGDGVVSRQHILRQTVVIRLDAGGDAEATLEDLVEKKAE